MTSHQNKSHIANGSQLDYVDLPKCTMYDSVHVYRQALEFKIPLLFWRLRAKKSDGELTRSQVYIVPSKPETRWQFIISKYNAESKKLYYTASFVRAEGSLGNVTVFGKLSILRNTTTPISADFSGLFPPRSTLTSKFMHFPDGITYPPKNDCYTLLCELEILQSGDHSLKSKETIENASILKALGNLWDNIAMNDVVIIRLADGTEECRAHKSILSARSQVFASMFRHDMEAVRTNSVTVSGIELPILRLLVQFMYTNEVPSEEWNGKNARKLLKAADKFVVNCLKSKCEDLLIESLSEENCTELLELGKTCSAKRLENEALSYVSLKIQRNITTVSALKRNQSDEEFVRWVASMPAVSKKFKK